MTPELAKKLRLQGITKAARSPFFQGKRINNKGHNFEQHCCHTCGIWFPCETEKCSHAVCVRIGPCCDPEAYPKSAVQKVKW